MSQHRKTIYAGRLISVAQYTVATGSMPPKERAGKIKATTEAMRKLNARYSCEKLALLLAMNMPKGSDVVTLTYDDNHYPKDRKRVEADLKTFRKKAAGIWAKKGKTFRMIWSIEHKHGDGRFHVHAVISRLTGNDWQIILDLWGRGGVDLSHLREDRDKNHISLARYMSKEADDQGNSRHTWHYTKNCMKPETDVQSGIPDSETLQLPKGAMLLESCSSHNEYGSWQYMKYYIPEDAPARTQRMVRGPEKKSK